MGSSRTTALARRTRKHLPTLGRSPVARPLEALKHPSWKLVGLAGIAGVAATGVVVARKRRAHRDVPPDELREHLHRRLAEVGEDAPAPPASPPS
jgi:hypothetical protein